MANKTVLDFLAVTSTDPADVFYVIRGTGAGRDKKITWANLTANLLDKTVTSAQTVVGPVSIVPTSDAVALSLTAKYNFRALAAECSHNNTTGSPPVISIKQTTSGDMGPGFGAAIRYQIRDDAGVDNAIADLRASRDDADNSGKVEIQVANAGVMATRLTVDKTGAGVFTGNVTATGNSLLNFASTHTNANEYALTLRHTTTNPMVDGFAVSLLAQLRDNSGVSNSVGQLRWERDGADDSAKASIFVSNSGTSLQAFIVQKDGTTRQASNPASSSDDTSLATTAFVKDVAISLPSGAYTDINAAWENQTPIHGMHYRLNVYVATSITSAAPIGTMFTMQSNITASNFLGFLDVAGRHSFVSIPSSRTGLLFIRAGLGWVGIGGSGT